MTSTSVIYDTETLHVIKRYKSLSGAKAALTRARKSGSMRYMCSFGYGRMKADRIAKLDVCTLSEFVNEKDKKVKVKNLMSGTEVEINASERGGCCDPSTERYWCM